MVSGIKDSDSSWVKNESSVQTQTDFLYKLLLKWIILHQNCPKDQNNKICQNKQQGLFRCWLNTEAIHLAGKLKIISKLVTALHQPSFSPNIWNANEKNESLDLLYTYNTG